ncbi:hypothetical protein FA15DRAFT_738240, partial [Coprinopsis marcescibilis]
FTSALYSCVCIIAASLLLVGAFPLGIFSQFVCSFVSLNTRVHFDFGKECWCFVLSKLSNKPFEYLTVFITYPVNVFHLA